MNNMQEQCLNTPNVQQVKYNGVKEILEEILKDFSTIIKKTKGKEFITYDYYYKLQEQIDKILERQKLGKDLEVASKQIEIERNNENYKLVIKKIVDLL